MYGNREESDSTFDSGLWLEGVCGWVETFNCCLSPKSDKIVGTGGIALTYLMGIGRSRA